jgi:hypothetical protein
LLLNPCLTRQLPPTRPPRPRPHATDRGATRLLRRP